MTTIPVLGIPVLNRPDLIRKCIDSIDHPVGTIAVINNSKDIGMTNMLKRICRKHRNVRVINNPKNAGVGGSWNQIFRTFSAPWWFIVGSDIRFERGSIAKIVREVEVHPESVLYFANGFSAFVITSRCLDIIGTFDENYYPAYLEDCDYFRRFQLSGTEARHIPEIRMEHVGSATIRSNPELQRKNGITHTENWVYHRAKWGDPAQFKTPFNDPNLTIKDWTLDQERRARQDWDNL